MVIFNLKLDYLESRECHFQRFSKVFSTSDAMLFHQNTSFCKTGNNVVEMSQAFHDITWFERFTDLNIFKYVFSVIQNWEADALQIIVIRWCLFFVSSYGRRKWKSLAKDGWLASGFGWLLALIDSPAQHPLRSQPVKKQKGWSLKTP